MSGGTARQEFKAETVREIESGQLSPLKEFRHATESRYLDALIETTGGDADRMCVIADVSRSGLYKLLGKHGKRLKR